MVRSHSWEVVLPIKLLDLLMKDTLPVLLSTNKRWALENESQMGKSLGGFAFILYTCPVHPN